MSDSSLKEIRRLKVALLNWGICPDCEKPICVEERLPTEKECHCTDGLKVNVLEAIIALQRGARVKHDEWYYFYDAKQVVELGIAKDLLSYSPILKSWEVKG